MEILSHEAFPAQCQDNGTLLQNQLKNRQYPFCRTELPASVAFVFVAVGKRNERNEMSTQGQSPQDHFLCVAVAANHQQSTIYCRPLLIFNATACLPNRFSESYVTNQTLNWRGTNAGVTFDTGADIQGNAWQQLIKWQMNGNYSGPELFGSSLF